MIRNLFPVFLSQSVYQSASLWVLGPLKEIVVLMALSSLDRLLYFLLALAVNVMFHARLRSLFPNTYEGTRVVKWQCISAKLR
ncbi:hypothetical protein WG66_013035 [Moniliophthora roreri]|nr:hypothetical protein WG66_013035 [Moniliophthora roreri]